MYYYRIRHHKTVVDAPDDDEVPSWCTYTYKYLYLTIEDTGGTGRERLLGSLTGHQLVSNPPYFDTIHYDAHVNDDYTDQYNRRGEIISNPDDYNHPKGREDRLPSSGELAGLIIYTRTSVIGLGRYTESHYNHVLVYLTFNESELGFPIYFFRGSWPIEVVDETGEFEKLFQGHVKYLPANPAYWFITPHDHWSQEHTLFFMLRGYSPDNILDAPFYETLVGAPTARLEKYEFNGPSDFEGSRYYDPPEFDGSNKITEMNGELPDIYGNVYGRWYQGLRPQAGYYSPLDEVSPITVLDRCFYDPGGTSCLPHDAQNPDSPTIEIYNPFYTFHTLRDTFEFSIDVYDMETWLDPNGWHDNGHAEYHIYYHLGGASPPEYTSSWTRLNLERPDEDPWSGYYDPSSDWKTYDIDPDPPNTNKRYQDDNLEFGTESTYVCSYSYPTPTSYPRIVLPGFLKKFVIDTSGYDAIHIIAFYVYYWWYGGEIDYPGSNDIQLPLGGRMRYYGPDRVTFNVRRTVGMYGPIASPFSGIIIPATRVAVSLHS